MIIKKMWKPAVAAMLVAGALPAQAEVSQPSTMQITATVVPSCTIDSSPAINLPALTLASLGTATGAINVTCTNGAGFDVLASLGEHADGAQGQLEGADAANLLHYNLYRNQTGDVFPVAAGNADTYQGTGASQPIPVYLKILAADLQAAKVDTYTDTVAFTVSY